MPQDNFKAMPLHSLEKGLEGQSKKGWPDNPNQDHGSGKALVTPMVPHPDHERWTVRIISACVY